MVFAIKQISPVRRLGQKIHDSSTCDTMICDDVIKMPGNVLLGQHRKIGGDAGANINAPRLDDGAVVR